MCVCKNFDAFYAESNPRWEVELNNGESIYMDDEGDKPSAWLRLRQYCIKHNLRIVKMRFGFRNNMRSLPENAEGYFFCKSALGMCGMLKTIHYFIVGVVQNNILRVTYWKVPEMIEEQTENRDISAAGECLI